MDNHLRQTHKIKDSVKFKKLLRSATAEIPHAVELDSDISEEDEYQDFRNSLRQYGIHDIEASTREAGSDVSDDEWMNSAVVEVCNKREKEKKKLLKNLGIYDF